MSGPARFLYTMTDCSLRTAQVEDCERIYQFIQELAVSEDRKDEVMITPEAHAHTASAYSVLIQSIDSIPVVFHYYEIKNDLRENGFGKDKLFYVLVAEMPLENPESGQKKMVGFLFYQYFYNSHFGKLLFVQDIFVRPENRSCGIGSLLWKEVMRRYRTFNNDANGKQLGRHHFMLNNQIKRTIFVL